MRRADAGDAEALALVAAATFLDAYAGFMMRDDMLAHLANKSSPERFAGWIGDGSSIVTLAETPVGQAPLGYTVLTEPDLPVEPHDGDIELLRIYALATTWGTGVGGDLMERAIADAKGAGKARVLLGTHPENFRAHRFYQRFGFSVIGQRTFRVGNAEFVDPVFGREL